MFRITPKIIPSRDELLSFCRTKNIFRPRKKHFVPIKKILSQNLSEKLLVEKLIEKILRHYENIWKDYENIL